MGEKGKVKGIGGQRGGAYANFYNRIGRYLNTLKGQSHEIFYAMLFTKQLLLVLLCRNVVRPF